MIDGVILKRLASTLMSVSVPGKPSGIEEAEAFELSGLAERFPDIDIENTRVGVFGKLSTLSTVLKPGDRVEIYRPILRNLDDEDDDD